MNKYNPELIGQLKDKYQNLGLSKGQVVTSLMADLKISHRQARRINSKYKISDYNVPAPQVKRKIKRIFWDIETSPNIVLSWRVGYKINLSEENILQERKIICIGYKWEGSNEVFVLTWDKNQDDKTMLEKFLEVANEADEMVFQNGNKFDLPWFRTRCIFHGLQCPPTYKTVDTLVIARRNFYFNSNKLDYLAKFLGLGQKMDTGYGLWKEIVLNNCKESLDKMVKYCGKDVILLEKVYNKLIGFVKHKTHEGVLAGNPKWTCPRDGSKNVKKNKTLVSAAGTITHQMLCKDCGSYYTISDSSYQQYRIDTR